MPAARVGPNDPRFSIQNFDAALQKPRLVDIIASGPLEVLAARYFKGPVPIPGHATVDIVAHIANSRITRGIRFADFACGVGRTVVGDDQDEIAKSLRQKRVKRLA